MIENLRESHLVDSKNTNYFKKHFLYMKWDGFIRLHESPFLPFLKNWFLLFLKSKGWKFRQFDKIECSILRQYSVNNDTGCASYCSVNNPPTHVAKIRKSNDYLLFFSIPFDSWRKITQESLKTSKSWFWKLRQFTSHSAISAI